MATIVQTAPLSDTVQSVNAATYSNQLGAAGAIPPITWTTTVFSSIVSVSPGGVVGINGEAAVGSYMVSGTMADSASNTGTWTFALTVVDLLSPQAVVTPVNPLAPTGIEVLVPFQIDPATGMVATQVDYAAVLEQHVLTILMTAPGERIMLPNYGVGLESQVFQPITAGIPSTLQSDIMQQLQAAEPSISVLQVEIEQDPGSPNVLDVTVTFTAVPYSGVRTVSVQVGGGIPSAPISQIKPVTGLIL